MSTVVTLGPVGFKPTGAYDNTREYKKLDVVIYQGSSYIAKSDSIGQLPTNTTYWELLVQKGDTGNGITSIAKTGTSGLVDTYTITYTDETTSTFTVTNGEKGDPGEVTEEQLYEAMARANMVYNALPKVSDEGDSLTLDGTANCPMKMELKGNTEQTTYTGKNLFDITNYPFSTNLNFDANGNVLSWIDYVGIPTYMPVQANTTYIQSNSLNLAFLRVVFYDENKTVISTLANTRTFTTPNDCKYIRFSMYSEGNVIPTWEQIEIGSTATPYEPYVGGTPSPNPDYPQDVRVVTGDNSVKVVGENLFDNVYGHTENVYTTHINANNPLGSVDCYPINLLPNTQYTLKVDMNGYQKTSEWIAGMCFANGDVISLLQLGSIEDITTTTFTTDSTGVVYVGQRYGFTYGTTGRMDLFLQTAKIQIEKGSATSFEPYQSQTYPINLGNIELCKIGNYQDYIYKDSGKWYKHSEIFKVVLDGSETINSLSNSRYQIALQISAGNGYNISISKCNLFRTIGQYEILSTTKENVMAVNGGFVYIRITSSTTLQEVITLLSNTNAIVYYVLATPTNTEITDTTLISQLNAIENAVSYDTQTNIVQENYSEPFIINAECVRSLKDIFELID